MHREPERIAQLPAQSSSKPSSVPVCFPVKGSHLQCSEFHDSGKPGHRVWTCSVQVSPLYSASSKSTIRSHLTGRLSVITLRPIVSGAFCKFSVYMVYYRQMWQVLSWLITFILLGTDWTGQASSKKPYEETWGLESCLMKTASLFLAKISAGCVSCWIWFWKAHTHSDLVTAFDTREMNPCYQEKEATHTALATKIQVDIQAEPAELASSECLAGAREGTFGVMVSGHNTGN